MKEKALVACLSVILSLVLFTIYLVGFYQMPTSITVRNIPLNSKYNPTFLDLSMLAQTGLVRCFANQEIETAMFSRTVTLPLDSGDALYYRTHWGSKKWHRIPHK